MKIFVNIVSYRDPLLWDTINSCLDNCSDPGRLHFGIVDQSDSEYDIQKHYARDQITYFHMSPKYSRGPCWARSMAYSFYNGQDYFLQVDSHTVFDKNWDTKLLNTLAECQKENIKSILSSYPPEFQFVDDTVVKNSTVGIVTIFRPKDDAAITEENPSFSFKGYTVRGTDPVKGFHIAGGFIFGPAEFISQVPYDPAMYFLGEEQNLAVRAWTSGWDIYQTSDIPVYHLYHTKTKRPLHWDKDDDLNRPVRWYELQKKSRQRLADLVFQRKNLGIYGLGTVRSIQDFAEFSGIDYTNETITWQEI